MTRAQKEQVRRIISPKPTTGRLEVPEDITTLWNTEKGKAKLFSLWCKSGGVKAGLAGELQGVLFRFLKFYISVSPCIDGSIKALLACTQAVFIERVEILSITTKTKTLEVKGGFYTIEDMKNELKYSQPIASTIVVYIPAFLVSSLFCFGHGGPPKAKGKN